MEQINNMQEQYQQEEIKSEYVPRNKIVAAKESIYDKMNLSVHQIDMFIGGCVAVIVVFIVLGLVM